ncbi:MAG: hypothetical protein NTV93_11350 [Verrucomicrobia bacterium]|nr:hypothetical protein [Verrucomicrobiota bacterium]
MNTPTTWKTESGSVSISPERGRVLGIEVAGHQALWSPPEVTAAWNLGGERLWIGPEADWHWQRLGTPDFAHYKVPPALDPDIWSVEQSRDGFFSGSVDIAVRSPHRDAHLTVRLTRSVELLPVEDLAAPGSGIALRTCTGMEILDGTPGQPVDFWSLLQIRSGGSLLIPSVGRAVPRDYFSPTPPSELSVHPTHTEIHIRGLAIFKTGISAAHSAGRVAYARPVQGGQLVLARSFPVYPELFYCDSPLDALDTQGDALQFFCDDGSFGGFGELEHRSPALRCGIGPQSFAEVATTRLMLLSDSEFSDWKNQWINHTTP